MKKTLLLTLPILLLASQNDVDKRILKLENELNSLKQETQYNKEDLNEGFTILDKVEKKSILDKVNFSPELRLRFDKFNYTNKSIQGENTMIYNHPDYQPDGTYNRRTDYTKNFDVATSLRFRLNMDVDMGDVKFHGRMLYMNATQSSERICILSRDIKTGTAGSAFDVDRAYVDYSVNPNSEYSFTFSFGILPTTGGTPMQYAQGNQRSSLFPALVFDMNTYGVIGTQKIGESTYVRAVVAKSYTLRPNFYPYQCNRENIDNAGIVGLYADTKFNFLGKSLLSFGTNIMHNLKAHPYLGPDVGSSDSHNLGSIGTIGLGLDVEKFASTNTTFFVHTAFSNPRPNGEKDDYQIVEITDTLDPENDQTFADGLTKDGKTGFTESTYASGEMLSEQSYSLYIGAKYDINDKFNFGAEYNYGSKYWFSGTQGAEEMYNKLAIRGTVYEVYGVWQYHKYLSTKISYLNIHEEYTGSGWHFGEPASKNATQSIAYLSLEAKF